MERESVRRFSFKDERAIVSMSNIRTVSKATFWKLLDRRRGAHMGFSERTDTILNGAERIPPINNPTDAVITSTGTVSKATLGKLLERQGGAHMGFSDRTDTILNGAERIPPINNPTDAFITNKGIDGETSGETGWSAYGLFRAHRYHPELHCTALSRADSAHKQPHRRIHHQDRY